METVSGRGINCENGVYFDFVDDCVVMTIYKDMPGTPMDRLQPNVIKSFPVSNWMDINDYLHHVKNDNEIEGEDVFEGEDEPDISPPDALPKIASIPSVLSVTNDKPNDKEEKEEDGKATSDKETTKA